MLKLSKLNDALASYSDKDWNYSRIILEEKSLEILNSPYAMVIDPIDIRSSDGRNEVITYEGEVTWGLRHSSELGILELISLRINKALLESTSDEYWDFVRPVIRLANTEELISKGITTALWYQVIEVAGDDFDNR